MNAKQRTIAICFLAVSLFISSCGQTTGKIEGIVLYSEPNPKTPIADATVTLFNSESGEEVAEVMTDAQGYYSFANVEPGKYNLGVIVEGCFILQFAIGDEDIISITPGIVVKKDIEMPCE